MVWVPRAGALATLMPYSYYRLTTRSGYGAGNKAPAYFELLWESMNGKGLSEAAFPSRPATWKAPQTQKIFSAGTPLSMAWQITRFI